MDAGRIQFNQSVNQKFGGSHADGEKSLSGAQSPEYEVAATEDQISILARPEEKKTKSGRMTSEKPQAENGQKEVNLQQPEKKPAPSQGDQLVSLALDVDGKALDRSAEPTIAVGSPLCEASQEDHDIGYFIAGEGINTAAFNGDATIDDILGDDPTPYLHSCYERPMASTASAFYATGLNSLDSIAKERKIFSVEGYEVASLI